MSPLAKQRIPIGILIIFIYIIATLTTPTVIFENSLLISHYEYLAQGFLSGHLYLSAEPSTLLLKLPDPYDPLTNKLISLFDASLYHGKYYLYFGPLPVLIFFLPYKWLIGSYPTEGLCTLLFLTLGFIANAMLLVRIKDDYFPFVSEKWLTFIVMTIGLSGNVLYLLNRPLIYEAAIASAYCMMSYALFFLYQALQNQCRYRDVFLFSLFAAAAVAGRANFALLCFYLFPVIFIYLILNAPKSRLLKLTMLLIIPASCIAAGLAVYNILRFNSIFEFGQHYQLTPYINAPKEGLFATHQLLKHMLYGTYYYLLQPYLEIVPTSFEVNLLHESTVGLFPLAPFCLFIVGLPSALYYAYKQNPDLRSLLNFILILLPIPVIMFICDLTLTGVTQRYEMDFSPYLFILAILTLWLTQTNQRHSPRKLTYINFLFMISGGLSILYGIMLGISIF